VAARRKTGDQASESQRYAVDFGRIGFGDETDLSRSEIGKMPRGSDLPHGNCSFGLAYAEDTACAEAVVATDFSVA